jgi:LysR family transcriptional regulator, carnitine catabolism transcriptional activator
MINISFKQLRAFSTVAREGNFRRAAEKLNLSPSALTISIRELETNLGLKLLERTTRSVQIAPQAIAFLSLVERFLNDLEHSVRDLKALSTGNSGSVVVGGSASFLAFVVAPAIGIMSKNYPRVSIRVIEDMTETLSEKIKAGEVDFGFATVWQSIPGISLTPLIKDRVGLLCSPQREDLCSCAKLQWSDIKDLPLISLPRASGMRGMFKQYPSLLSTIENPNYEVTSNLAMLDLVERDVGVAIIPALSARHQENPQRVFRPLTNPVVWRKLCLLHSTRNSLSPVASVLLRHVMEVIQDLPLDKDVRRDD